MERERKIKEERKRRRERQSHMKSSNKNTNKKHGECVKRFDREPRSIIAFHIQAFGSNRLKSQVVMIMHVVVILTKPFG